jgi:hypothetical protein
MNYPRRAGTADILTTLISPEDFMRSSLSLLALAASLFLAACNDPASGPLASKDPAPALSKAAQPTLLGITVQDSDSFGAAYRIQSDGLGEYVHGVQTVTAEIDASGNLQFGPALSSALARRLRFDFSAPVDPLDSYRPNESGQQEWKIKTNPNIVPGTPAINSLGLNGNPVSGCYGSTVSHQNAGTRYPIIYNTVSDPQSVNVYITRTSISPATWTVVTNGPCAGTANQGALYSQSTTGGNPPLVFHGYYNLSFSLRLRAL